MKSYTDKPKPNIPKDQTKPPPAPHIELGSSKGVWHPVALQAPPIGLEVLGYCEDWIDEDFNVKGVRLCFVLDDDYWFSCKWCNSQDCWVTVEHDDDIESKPTHWMFIPHKS